MRLHCQPFAERGADDHDVLCHGRRRVETDFTGLERDLLPLADDGADFQIDDAVLAELTDRRAGVRVQRHEVVARADEQHAIVALAVGPVGEAAARELPRRGNGARPLAQRVHPHQLAALRIERDDRAAGAAGRVHDPLHHQRGAFQLVLGTCAEIVGLEAPRDFELVEVGCVDLIERRVARAFHVRGVVRPLAVLRAREVRRLGMHERQHRRGSDDRRNAQSNAFHRSLFSWLA